jgi:serine/threonine protein kinase
VLAPGFRFGTYEVLERLAEGGMGDVFRARDTRLDRDVAIKVLREPFRLDAQRSAMLEREARVLASLNHPNIATLYGIESVLDSQALVLELVDGETLAERIAGSPIPLEDAVMIAQQVAAALEAAHEHGVVHRDLKPQNVKLRADGNVKLLDFGLAKVLSPFAGAGPDASTIVAPAGGAVAGTPRYMSPEQARGIAIDKRTDIWAFGCLLYEMLAGRPAFSGEHASDLVAAIIEREPDFSALPRSTPIALRRLLRRCLEKDPRRRLRDIGDASLELTEFQAGRPDGTERLPRDASARRVTNLSLAAGLAALLAAGAAWWFASDSGHPPVNRRVVRFLVSTGPDSSSLAMEQTLAMAPDGSKFAYMSGRGLEVRALDQVAGRLLVRTTDPGSGAPFFSPDGRWVGFTDGQTLKKVPVEGGTPTKIVETAPAAIASWSGDEIFFGSMSGLFRVPAAGGRVERVPIALGPSEQALYPQLLPDGRTLIVTIGASRTNTPGGLANAPGAYVDAVDLPTGARRTLVRGGGRAVYVPTGHLLYASGESLHAVPFDVQKLELRGEPALVATQVLQADFAVSTEGTLAFVRGAARRHALAWVDRDGKEELLDAPPFDYKYPRLSPDGRRIALDAYSQSGRDMWIWDLTRKTLERFTPDPAGNALLAWDRDGEHLVFGSDRSGVANLFIQASDGSGEPQRLLESDRHQQPMSFAPDGRLIYSVDVPGRGRDVHALSMDGSDRVEPILHSAANDLWAEVSPDGRWIAYDSDESGQMEVYVRQYPDAYGGGRWQVSSGGGRQPLWSRDGREIFYRDYSGAMLAVPVAASGTFAAGPAVKLFSNPDYVGAGAQGSGRTYDLSRDGDRFLMIKQLPGDGENERSLVVVLNWFAELERLAPQNP